MTKEEKSNFDAAVQQAVAKIMAEQQQQYAKVLEATIKNSLKGIDQANAALGKERKAVLKELDAAKKTRDKAEKEGDKMASDYFAGRQEQFREAAQTELLRNLTRMHLELGKSNRDIAVWLDVPQGFVENIRQLLERVKKFAMDTPPRIQLEGNPKLIYEGSGRGGTIWFESRETRFDMWWEYGGGDALVIVAIPTAEKWEATTNLPVSRRNDILTFVGEQIVVDHVSGTGSFIIGENVLTVYRSAAR